jgi:hypothetical protein
MKMKNKTFKALLLTTSMAFILLTACDTEPEKIFGKVEVHNESSDTITRIRIDKNYGVLGYEQVFTERVSIAPGGKSKQYSLELETSEYLGKMTKYRIVITVGGGEKSVIIEAYQNYLTKLYYNGTELVERE